MENKELIIKGEIDIIKKIKQLKHHKVIDIKNKYIKKWRNLKNIRKYIIILIKIVKKKN